MKNRSGEKIKLASVCCMYSRCNVPCVIGSEINHSQQNALNRQFPVQPFLYCKNGLDQLLKSFHRQICGLYRYQHGIGRDQCRGKKYLHALSERKSCRGIYEIDTGGFE